MLGHTAQDNRTLDIQQRTNSTNSGPKVKKLAQAKKEQGWEKHQWDVMLAHGMAEKLGWYSPIIGYIVCGKGKDRPLSILKHDRIMMGMTSRKMSPSGFISGDGQARKIFCSHLKKTTYRLTLPHAVEQMVHHDTNGTQ